MKIQHRSDYSKKRADAYPSIEEQLDMLWHAMNDGVVSKAEPFYTTINEVKKRFPKAK